MENRGADYIKNLQIPFLKLHFTAELVEDCVLPKSKASALRGGTGHMMIEQNCVLPKVDLHDSDCLQCDCYEECLVQRFLYTPMSVKPDFATDKSSQGYIFECEDYRENFEAGETFCFNVVIFGKSRVYVNLLLQAIWALGNAGLGREHGRFLLREIQNGKKQTVMKYTDAGPQILKKNLQPESLAEYVDFRKRQVMRERTEEGSLFIKFQADTSLKYNKEIVDTFSSEAVFSNLYRRIYLINCFVGNFIDYYPWEEDLKNRIPKMLSQESKKFLGKRYSTRKQNAMAMNGIVGNLEVTMPDEEILDYLLAGEILHIGRNTSFGFGRYRVM